MPSATAVPPTPGRSASANIETPVAASPTFAGPRRPRRSPQRPANGDSPASTAIEAANRIPIAELESPRRASRSSGATTSTRPSKQALPSMIPAAQAPTPERVARMIAGSAGATGAVRGASRGNTATAANISPSASPQKIRNGASNENTSAVTPPSAGPAIEPAPVAPRATPNASPRRPGGAVSDTSARAEIQLAADPTP